MDYFSSSQKRKIRDMAELEFYGKDHELLKEGSYNNRAYIILKGEVELRSSVNLYTLGL